jgi:carbonic anhydrase/acetyltransferase-like protein (isoleucine patch superfamily)
MAGGNNRHGAFAGKKTDLPEPMVFSVNGIEPRIAPDVFLAPGSVVAGDVEIGPGSSVWFNAVVRGDSAPVRIGARTNVQDGAVLHVDPGAPCVVGNDVTIGHRAIVHGTTVGDGVTIGMGSIVLSRSRVGERAIVAAGAVVAEDAVVDPGVLVMGVPARVKRELSPEEQHRSAITASHYVANAERFQATLTAVSHRQIDQFRGEPSGS